jgi:hypothetical protein
MDLAEKLVGNVRSMAISKVNVGNDGDQVWLMDLFPWIEPVGLKKDCATEEFNCVGRNGKGPEPCFFAKSPGTSFAGFHPTGGHCDDLTTEKGAKSPSIRIDGIEFLQRLTPILRRRYRSPVTAAATPWHFFDTTAYYRSAPEWSVYHKGILDGRNGDKTLCPSVLNWDEWVKVRDNPELPEEFKAAQYLCNPIPGANALFSRALLDSATNKEWTLEKVLSFKQFGSYALWDPTSRTEANALKGDGNGCVILKAVPNSLVGVKGVEPDKNIWFVVRAHEERGGADAMLHWLSDEAIIAHPDIAKIGIEEIFLQSFVTPWATMKATKRLPFEAVPIGSAGKPFRLMGIATAIRQGLLIFPPDFPGRQLLLQQLIEYPKSPRDDVACALALLSSFFYRRGHIPPPVMTFANPALHTRPRRRHNRPADAWSL